MDFQKFTNNLTKTASKALNNAATFGAEKIAASRITIDSKKELEDFIAESQTTTYTKENGEEKTFSHTVIVVFWKESSNFFKDALLHFPILVTKAFAQNIKLKLAKAEIKDVQLTDYNIQSTPAMCIFTNEKLVKTIQWEENIEKITKSFTIDILSEIEKY